MEVNVTQGGNYRIELSLRPYIPVWDSYFGGSSISKDYDRGVHNLSVQLYVTLPYSLRLDTAYVIESVGITDNNWNGIDSAYRSYITHQYKSSEFDFPDAILTGNYWDYGVDTNADGKYNSLAIDVEINVTQPGTYHFEFNIHSLNWEYNEWESFDVVFQEGIHNISLSIDNFIHIFIIHEKGSFWIKEK